MEPKSRLVSLLLALGCAALAVSSGSAEGVPFSIFRLGGATDEKGWPKTLEMIRRNRDVIDEVWFSTGCDIPPVEAHRTRGARQAEIAEDLRKLGIVASLQVQATIGHGSSSRKGKPAAHRTWTGFTGADGYEAWDCNCPRDPNYRAYWREAIRPYAAWKPGSVWIDDDLRLIWHDAVQEGCFCGRCVEAFARKEARPFTRETLLAAMKKDPRLRERWVAHGFEGLAGLAGEIAAEIRRLSPKTRMGLQYPWADRGQLQILDALAKAAGGKVGVRPGYGAYTDLNPLDQIEKVNRISRQLKTLSARRSILDQVCPEIETYPRNFGTRTAKSLAFEALCGLAQGCDSLSWYVSTGGEETTAWYDRVVLRALRENMALYRAFARANRNTVACGFTAPDLDDGPYAPNWPVEYSLSGVPYTFGDGELIGTTLTSFFVDRLSDAQLAKVLAGATLIDGKALAKLQKRNLLPKSIRGAGRYVTPQGGRLGISPSLSPKNANAAENRRYRERALHAARYLPAEVLDPCLAAVWCRVKDDGSRCFASMTLLNARIDEQEPVRVRLMHFPTEHAVWWELGKKPVELKVTRSKGWVNRCEVTLPALGAWSAGCLLPGRVEKGDWAEERAGVAVEGRIETAFGHLFPEQHHVQGVDVTEEALYFTQSGALQKTDWNGRCLARKVAKCHHNGDVCVHGGKVFVVHARQFDGDTFSRILVYDKDLRLMRESGRLCVTNMPLRLDGLTVYDGCLVSVHHPAEVNARKPQDTAYLVRIDLERLEALDVTEVKLGFKTRYFLPQNLATDGEFLYLGCYGQDDRKIPDLLVVDRAFKPVRTMRTECGEGFAVVPEGVSNRVVGAAAKGRFLVGHTLWTQGSPRQYILECLRPRNHHP